MDKVPEITVLMPVYNAGKYLRKAIESILNQSFADFEFLIIDDGSTDGSVEMIQAYCDPRIRFYRNEKNSGIAFTLNRGLALASGKYIARMDADDISSPERLAEQYDFMWKNPEIVLSGAFAEKIGPDGEHIGLILIPEDDVSLRIMLLFNSCFVHPLTIFNKEEALSAGGYSERDSHAEDYGLWLRMASRGKLANLNKVLLKYRWSGENISAQKHSLQHNTAFEVSYSAVNTAMGENIPQDIYIKFWYLWQFHEGAMDVATIRALNPLWKFVSGLPTANMVLGKPWGELAIYMVRSGNVFAGIVLLKVLKQKFGFAPPMKDKIFAIVHGLLQSLK